MPSKRFICSSCGREVWKAPIYHNDYENYFTHVGGDHSPICAGGVAQQIFPLTYEPKHAKVET